MIKTAGTTMHYILRNNYGLNYVEISKPAFNHDNLSSLLRVNKSIKAIGGHSLRSVTKLELACPEIKYITFLRDPINRYISHYNHGRGINSHQMSFEERIKILGEADYQTKFITGSFDLADRNFLAGKKELEKAKQILAKEFLFVGLVEKFDESLILFRNVLKSRNFDIRYQRINTTEHKHVQRNRIPLYVLEELRQMNKTDYELYRFAKDELFEAQKVKYGGNLGEDLNDFRHSNRKYVFRTAQLLKFRIGKYLIYKLISS
jgi:hypothetical protein